ncbi:MAG: DUF2914 domain-containing protein [Calditrichaeota bacterium]|nr:MAG: DUF2914 domain-containing protein [Calditrichota bacterium]
MNDVFLSYSSEDRIKAEQLAQVLIKCGYDVWWDKELLSGQKYAKAIISALSNSKCVLVLWSNKSIDSNWVMDEAGRGRDRNVLVPALIEDVEIPIGFGQFQTASLIHWNGKIIDPEFQKLLDSIALFAGDKLKEIEDEIIGRLGKQINRRTSIRGLERMLDEVDEFSTDYRNTSQIRRLKDRLEEAKISAKNRELNKAAGKKSIPFGRFLKKFTLVTLMSISVLSLIYFAHPIKEKFYSALREYKLNAAKQGYAKLLAQSEDISYSYAEVLSKYQKFIEDYSAYISKDSMTVIEKNAETYQRIVGAYEKAKMWDNNDDKTRKQKLDLWTNFVKRKQNRSEVTYANQRILELGRPVATASVSPASVSAAWIDDPQTNLVMCSSVKNKEPVDIRTTFITGSRICVYARIHTPRKAEDITIKWYSKGKLIHKKEIRITQSKSYRTWDWKIGNRSHIGENEVRLFNGKNEEIGAKKFMITNLSMTE